MRYLPLNDADRATMLERIGVENIDALFCDVPAEARLDGPVDLPIHKSEMQVERDMQAMAGQNMTAGSAPFFCGAALIVIMFRRRLTILFSGRNF